MKVKTMQSSLIAAGLLALATIISVLSGRWIGEF